MSRVDRDSVKNEAKRRVHNLVEDYMRVLATGKKESFNEERVKIAFVVPFLDALGWNPRTDEVLPEQATLTGRADFGLRVGGRTKIFVEMKRFSKSLDGHYTVKGKPRSFAEQAIQYAWGMKASWAVLTNFEEIRLYDSHVKKPEDGLVWKKPIKFTEYESRFDELWLISRQSVVSGALDAYKAKIQRPPVDKAFLDDLMNCRQLLAEDIKNNNPGLTYDQINESVQKLLDRLIFIKNCEDRLIIPAESLWKRFKAWQETAIDKEIVIFMMDLKNLFRYFDKVYNGKLFEKHPCEDLKISNEVFEEIINTLYGDGQHLGYNFSVIPVDVLGQAYELYIGSIIKEKEGKAKAVEIVKKPAKRKAHGIYYTPEPVVNYIVRGTLGKVLERCRTPEDVSRIKVLDPACGSGSFLIKAFDVIKEWYENYNKLNRPTRVPGTLDAHIVPIPNPEERILTENLYGVDLDTQAVEITILNLSLKAVKTKEKLPYIADHIKCGNSLIDDEKIAGDKAFKWKEEFEEIMKEGGFEVIIGNPPYFLMQPQNTPRQLLEYLKEKFSVARYKIDTYHLFFERAISLLKEGGYFGFITPNTYLMNIYANNLRKYILCSCKISKIVVIPNEVFSEASVDTAITILQRDTDEERRRQNKIEILKVEDLLGKAYKTTTIEQNDFFKEGNYAFNVNISEEESSVIKKVTDHTVPLGEISRVSFGLQTKDKKTYVKDSPLNDNWKPCIDGGDISRYGLKFNSQYFLHDTAIKAGGCWDESTHNVAEKIVIRQIGVTPIATLDTSRFYCLNTIYNITSLVANFSYRYILALVNSELIRFFWITKFYDSKRLFPKIKKAYLDQIPVKKISLDEQRPLIELVDKILSLNSRLDEIDDRRPGERIQIEEEAKKTDREIDGLIYKIYGITEVEKKIIEGSLK